MHSLLPLSAEDIAPYDFYRPAEPGAPWLRINMVASVDGLVTDAEGRSGGLGADGDRAAFRAQRALADAILVGAGTVRAENYGPHLVHRSVAERRRADGRQQPASVVVVSLSLDLDPGSRLFTDAVTPTMIMTSALSPMERRQQLATVGEIIVAGDDQIDLADGIAQLRSRGLPHVLCEGGPRLNAALLQANLVDEICLTIAPQILGSNGKRMVDAATPVPAAEVSRLPMEPTALELLGLGRQDDELFIRYGLATAHRSIGMGNTGGPR